MPAVAALMAAQNCQAMGHCHEMIPEFAFAFCVVCAVLVCIVIRDSIKARRK